MYGYGMWVIAAVNTFVFLIFAFSFTRPRKGRDWRSFGAFSAFIVALFTEMYGFPLTIYLLSGWLGSRFPALSFSHDGGHLWYSLMGLHGDPHQYPIHMLSEWMILAGMIFLAVTWKYLHRAQQNGQVAAKGPYAWMRHPQYAAFILILTGFLVQWPTILTVVMYPVLLFMYVHLAGLEEKESLEYFGEAYQKYMESVPKWGFSFKKQPGKREISHMEK